MKILISSILSAVTGAILRAWLRAFPVPKSITPANTGKADTGCRSQDIEPTGRWFFHRDILGRLEEYRHMADTFRRRAPSAYRRHNNQGAVIVGGKTLYPNFGHVPPARSDQDFGSVFWFRNPKDGQTVVPRFAFFERYDRPPSHVQRMSGKIYKLGYLYHDGKKFDQLEIVWVCVRGDGEVVPLRERRVAAQSLPGTYVQIKHNRWDLPWLPVESAARIGVSLQEFTKWLFVTLTETWRSSRMDVKVALVWRRCSAAFHVDLLQIPAFFRDRTPVVIGGKKKKIFHIVRAHERFTKTGRQVVRTHFRGIRNFEWNGCSVRILMPGFHEPV